MRSVSTILAPAVLVLAALAATGCATPENPPVRAEPAWPSDEVKALAQRACFDCHSNETKWPAYSAVPIVSALIEHDVFEGREALNFSEWDRSQEDVDELGEIVREGEMPLAIYLPMHPEASLSATEKETLARGLEAMVAADPPPGEKADDDDD